MEAEGEVLRKAVKQAKYKQEDFALDMGFSRNYFLQLCDKATLQKAIIDKAQQVLLKRGVNLLELIANNKSNVTEFNPNIMLVPLVSQYAYAGYTAGYADEEYINELPTEPFYVDRSHKGTYRAFEVKGDSMDDGTKYSICERDKVLGREISQNLWVNKLHIHKYNFVIVTKREGILFKQITEHNPKTGDITIHSLNPFFEDVKMNLKDVAQLFNVVQINRNT